MAHIPSAARAVGAAAVMLAMLTAPEARSTGSGNLPPGTLRGPAHRLDQYPAVGLATASERAAARRLLVELKRAANAWRTPAAAAAAGFDTTRPRRKPRNRVATLWFHAERRPLAGDARPVIDPRRPKALIYADVPGRPLALVGVMFSMQRGVRGPTPGGPITRWHTHVVCARGARRGLAPRRDGSCPPGTTKRLGSEMLHAWFTRDLRSAYAIHAPVPELCVARRLPASRCRHPRHAHG